MKVRCCFLLLLLLAPSAALAADVAQNPDQTMSLAFRLGRISGDRAFRVWERPETTSWDYTATRFSLDAILPTTPWLSFTLSFESVTDGSQGGLDRGAIYFTDTHRTYEAGLKFYIP